MAATRSTSAVVGLSVVLAAFAKWFLVWLFARSAGGASAVGTYSAILAVATPLFVACQLGLRTIYLSAAKRWPWRVYWGLRLAGVVVGAVVMIVFIEVSGQAASGLALAIVGLKVCDSLYDLQIARVQYANRLALVGLVGIVNALVTIVGAAIAVLLTGSAVLAVGASAASSAMSCVWAHRAGRETTDEEAEASSSGLGPIFQASVPVTASQFLSSLLFQLPVLALAAIASPSTIGVYAGVGYLITAANLAGSTLQTLLITPFRKLRATSGDQALKRHSWLVSVRVLGVGALVSVPIVLVGSPVLRFIYGPEFAIDRLPILLMAIGAVTSTCAFTLSVALNVLNAYARVTAVMGLSCAISALTGVVLCILSVDHMTLACSMVAAGSISRFVVMVWAAKNA